ncbi:MAG: TonB family protein [Bryobacterales bacterium]|nr:TonB family protein [Bryobacterales bacterium]
MNWTGEIAIKSTAVLFLALLASLPLRRAPAAARHFVWASALAALLVLPLASVWTPRFVQVPIPSPSAPVFGTPVSAASQDGGAPARPRLPWEVFVWAAGAIALSLRATASLARVWKVSRDSAEVPRPGHWDAIAADLSRTIGLRRQVALRVTRAEIMPMTWGAISPEIVLPASAASWPEVRLRVVLLHELIHVKRGDFLTQWLARLACACYWFHPLAWFAARQLHLERERACDDGVLRYGEEGPGYAQLLVDLAKSMRPPAEPAAVAMAQISNLEDRVMNILNKQANRRGLSRRAAGMAGVAAIAFVLVLAGVHAGAQSATAGIVGVVRDESGGAVPKAAVTVRSGAGKEMAWTNDAGEFLFPNLPEGSYTLTVAKPGFALYEGKPVGIHANAVERADVTLSLGRVSEMLEVVGKAPARVSVAPAGPPKRIRVGGDVQATRLIERTNPVYPEKAQREGAQGTVLIDAVILVDGTLGGVRTANAVVNPDLAAAALDAVKQWRFQPTLLNGVPVEVITTITVNFRLAP